MRKRQRSIRGSLIPSGALCYCMFGFMLLKPSAGQASSSLKLRTGPVGPHEQAEVLRELQFIRRRYDEARQLLSADLEGDEHPLLVRRALRLLEANVRQWESIEPRARGSQSYDEGILLIAKNRAAIGDAYAKMGEIELALAELETSCPILWELQRSKRKPLGSMLASTLWSPHQAHSSSSHQPAVLAPSHGEQSMLKSVSSSSSPGSAFSAVDGSGIDTADSWLACYASLANLYTESQSQRDISDLHANAPWMGSGVAGNKVGRDAAVSQHALKLQTLAMISKLSILSGSQSEGSGQQISVSKRVVWGEAKAMRTHLHEIVKQFTTINTADQGRTLYEKAQAWIQVTEADARRILDSLAERKAADVAAATAAPSTDDASGGSTDDATQSARLVAAATEASAAERALLLGELKREGAHYLSVFEGVLTEGWGYIDLELKRAADSVYYRSNLGTEGFQTRADVLRAFRSTLSEILAEKEALPAERTEPVAKQEPTNDVVLGCSGSALAAILGTLIVAVLAGWPSLKASRARSRRVASLAAATRRQQQHETNDTEGFHGNSTSGRRRTGSTDKTGSQHQQQASHDDIKTKRRLTWPQRLRAVLKTITTFLRRLRRSIKSSVFSWMRFLRRRLTSAVARFRGALTSVGSALMFTFRRPVSRIDLFDEPLVKPVKTTKGGKGKASATHDRSSAASKKASRGSGVNSSSGKGKAQNQKPSSSSSSSALPPPRRTSSTDSISSASDVPVSPSASDDAAAAKLQTPPRPITQRDPSTKLVRSPVKSVESSKPQRKSRERKPLPVVAVVQEVATDGEVKTEAADAGSIVSFDEADKAVPEVEMVVASPEGKDREPLEGPQADQAPAALVEVASVEPDVHVQDPVTPAVVVDERVKEDEEESEEGRTTDEGTDEDLVDDDEDLIDDAATRHLTEAAAEMEAVCEPATAVMPERSASPTVAAASPPSPTPEPPTAPTSTTSPRQHRAQASPAVSKPSSPRPTCKASSSGASVRTPSAPTASSSRREHQQQHAQTAPSQQHQQRARAPKRSLSAGPGREPREDERYSHASVAQPKAPSGRPKRPLRTPTSAAVPSPSSPPQTPRATPPHQEQQQQPLVVQQQEQQPIHNFIQQEEAQRQQMLAQSQMQQQPQPQPQPHPQPQPLQQHHHHPHHFCAHPYAPLPPQLSQQQQQHPSPQPPSEAGMSMAPTPTSTGVSTAMMGSMMPPPAPAEPQNYTPPSGMRITLPSQGPPPPHPQMMMQPPIHMPIPSVGHPGYGPPPFPVAPPGSHSPAAFMPHPDWIYRSMSASPTFYSPPPPPSPVTREDLEVAIRRQIEYYFSVENLCKDLYLRSKMDEEGYVSLAEIANFNRVKQLTGDLRLIVKSVQTSPRIDLRMPWALRALEGGGDASMTGPDGQMALPSDPAHLHTLYLQCKLRTREHPERWVQTQRPEQ